MVVSFFSWPWLQLEGVPACTPSFSAVVSPIAIFSVEMESGMHGDDAMRLKLAVALAMWRTSHRPQSGTEENQWRKKVHSATLKFYVVRVGCGI